jgi:hypothetical protein
MINPTEIELFRERHKRLLLGLRNATVIVHGIVVIIMIIIIKIITVLAVCELHKYRITQTNLVSIAITEHT